MKNKNTISMCEFICNTLFYGFAVAIFYRIACFSAVYGMNVVESRVFYWSLSVALLISGILITYKKRRNKVSMLVNIFLPVEVYTVVSTFRYMPEVYTVLFAIVGVLSVGYFIIVMTRKVGNKKYILPTMCNRMKFGLLGVRTIATALMLVVTLNVCSDKIFGYGLVNSDVEADISDSAYSEWTIENQIETIVLLEPSRWKCLSISEKIDVLGVVKNITMRKFGVSHEVYLDASDLERGITGSYFDQDHRISIDVEHLKSSESDAVLKTLLHECMHVYQHMCVELYDNLDDEYKQMPMFSEAVQYKKNFSNYIDGGEDFEGYYNQTVETAAREYAEMMADSYFCYIEEFLLYGDLSVG